MSPSTSGPVVGDAVADDLVDRRAERLGEGAVVEGAGVAAAADALLVAQGVELVGGDAGRHRRAHGLQDLGRGPAGPAHALDDLGRAHVGLGPAHGHARLGVGRPGDLGRHRPGRADAARADVVGAGLVAALELAPAAAPAGVVGLEGAGWWT